MSETICDGIDREQLRRTLIAVRDTGGRVDDLTHVPAAWRDDLRALIAEVWNTTDPAAADNAVD